MRLQSLLESFKGDPIHLFLAFHAFFEEKKMDKKKQLLEWVNSHNRETEI